jgi:Flp pilus assembly protein TadG
MSNLAKLNQFKRYLRNSAGSIAPIFALAAIPFLMVAGAAVDMTRVSREQTTFFSSVDGAALAIAADDRAAITGLSDSAKTARIAELETYAMVYLQKNYIKGEFRDKPTNFTVDLDITGSGVKLDATVEFPMTFMSMVGINTMTLNADAEVRFAMKPIEMVMVMDTTGSMASDNKMTGAKDAAKKLLDTLYGANSAAAPRSEFIRTALVPFSGAVRLNTSAGSDFKLSWIDTTGVNPLSKLNYNAAAAPAEWNNHYAWSKLKKSTGTTAAAFHTWNGCVEARLRGAAASGQDFNANDAAPVPSSPSATGPNHTLFPAYFNPDVPSSSSGTNYGVDYISSSSSTNPNEYTGLTSTQKSDTSTAGLRLKQENYRKYDGRNIGAESSSTSGPWSNCANAPIVPMTYDRTSIVSGINAMQPQGPTLIPEGLAWGWRVISPTEPFTDVSGSGAIPAAKIAPYNGPRWNKYMVLMTDGDNDLGPNSSNYNTTTYSAYGFASESGTNNRFGTTSASGNEAAVDSEMTKICTKIKAEGIKLYVTSFGSGVSPETKGRLQTCSSGADYYTHAATTTALVAFFDHIGKDVLSKSIYVAK